MERTTEHIGRVAAELGIRPAQVLAASSLLDEGATVPFIARYRKEATGLLDEVAITSIRDRMAELHELDKRRIAILKSLEERGLLTDGLKTAVTAASTMAELEDVYLPYRPKRRTRAMVARERGLEPLAQAIFNQTGLDPVSEAAAFIDPGKEINSAGDALAGARDIIAEWVSEDKAARERLRAYYAAHATIRSRVAKDREAAGAKYRDYFDWEEPARSAPSHRVLAIRRGEREECLIMRATPPDEGAVSILTAMFVRGSGADSGQVRLAVEDGYKRLLSFSMEAELRLALKKRADDEAIRVFKENLRQLLLAPPLGQKNVLAIDPGFRTGCKVVCLDAQGGLKHYETVFLLGSDAALAKAKNTILGLCEKYEIEAIAIGNGTAGRETEAFIRGIGLRGDIQIVSVNESGASIYSASEAARAEFPDADITVRGSVSIGRRVMDPLAELVKIDPKSIGVGQYQHDVDQGMLRQGLDDVVVSCVNAVGVEVNTASAQLLSYVSGLGPSLAQNIVRHREEHGPFKRRAALKEVPRLGPKAFEQAAGFLRVAGAENPLDASAVHPESYQIVEAMATDLGVSVGELIERPEMRLKIDLTAYITDTVGLPTLQDIMEELAKPGRDPRAAFEGFSFKEGVSELKDLEPGMRLAGVVTNITNFGAFVDIGVHQDGLVHISQLSDRYVKDPAQAVKVGQRVDALVLEVDIGRRRISLSLKKDPEAAKLRPDKEEAPAGRKPAPKPDKPRTSLADAFKRAGGR